MGTGLTTRAGMCSSSLSLSFVLCLCSLSLSCLGLYFFLLLLLYCCSFSFICIVGFLREWWRLFFISDRYVLHLCLFIIIIFFLSSVCFILRFWELACSLSMHHYTVS